MDELISRKDAIAVVEKLDIPEDMCVFEILSHIELAIGTLQPAQQWIPVSERLPESNSERIILLYDNGLISGGKYLGDRTFEIDFRDNDKKTKVVAWMLVPEAYKESEE